MHACNNVAAILLPIALPKRIAVGHRNLSRDSYSMVIRNDYVICVNPT